MVEEHDLLACQLRAYGDALEAEHAERAAAVGSAVDPFGGRRDVRWVLAVAAAVLLVVSGSVAWVLRDSGGDVVDTDVTDESVTTTIPFDVAPQDAIAPDSRSRSGNASGEWTVLSA